MEKKWLELIRLSIMIRAVCIDGGPSPYLDRRRPGCVNEKKQIDNYYDFREYTINRNEFLIDQNQKLSQV
jgi:hypothetical protein